MYKTSSALPLASGQSFVESVHRAWCEWSSAPCRFLSELLSAPITKGQALGVAIGDALLAVALLLPSWAGSEAAGWCVALFVISMTLAWPFLKCFIEKGEE